jgi:hypothetical protein
MQNKTTTLEIGMGAHLVDGRVANGYGWLYTPEPVFDRSLVDTTVHHGHVRISAEAAGYNGLALTPFGERLILPLLVAEFFELWSGEPDQVRWQLCQEWRLVTAEEHVAGVEKIHQTVRSSFPGEVTFTLRGARS